MKDLIVLMGASEHYGTMDLYLGQLDAAGIDRHVVDNANRPNQNGGGNLGYRVKIFRELAEQFMEYQFLIMTDAFDVTFYGKKSDVLKKLPKDHLLHGAEKNCYPDVAIAPFIRGTTPWKFANGGMVAGTPDMFIDWCGYAERHLQYDPNMLDQQFLNILVAEHEKDVKFASRCVIDETTKLFYCLYGGYDELGFDNGLPVNTACCTFPNFLHANGKWTAHEMFARYERSLK
jgi:hypothetical protein